MNEEKTNWLGSTVIVGLIVGAISIFNSDVEYDSTVPPTPAAVQKAAAPISIPTVENVPTVRKKEPQTSSCHPSYSGCLKQNAGDYDCAGGTGNGPNYTGPVQVYGSDPFDLDRDGDGWACERN